MASDNGSQEKAAVEARVIGRSVQEQIPLEQAGMLGHDMGSVLFFTARADEEIEPWGQNVKLRDQQLRSFISQEPTFASALGMVAARNATFSWKLEGPEVQVKRYSRILQTANFGKGWAHLMAQISIDLATQDSGAFIEVIRMADSEKSPVVGLNALDAARCYPTGVDEVPVIYLDRLGHYHWLKWYQIIHLTEIPATYEGLPGLQYCTLTRAMRACRIMRDIGIYLSEKIGGRNARAVTLVKGVTPEQIEAAWNQHRLRSDSAGLLRYSQPLLVGAIDPKAEIGFQTLEIASLPDGFDLDLSMKQYIGQLAMAFMVDYQEFAPLPGGGLGTSAQSEVLHMKSRGKGPGLFMKLVAEALNFAVLPESVQFLWDDQDPDADKAAVETGKLRAESRALRIESGELTIEVARKIAFEEGDLSKEMLDALEAREAIEEDRVDEPLPSEEIDAIATGEATPEAQETTAGEDVLEEGEKTSDDRAGTPAVEEARLETEQEIADAIEQAFAIAHERLMHRVGA